MAARDCGPLLPRGTLIYREYEAVLPDDTRTTVAITLDDLDDKSEAAASARTGGAAVYGHILILDSDECESPMTWTWDGADLHVLAVPREADAMPAELRAAISSFLIHFLDTIRQEIEALEAPKVH